MAEAVWAEPRAVLSFFVHGLGNLEKVDVTLFEAYNNQISYNRTTVGYCEY